MSSQLMNMYDAIPNSPLVFLTQNINAAATEIQISSGANLPNAPNIASIGLEEDTETVLYMQKSGNMLSGVQRGFQGTAKSWPSGAPMARVFTAYDLNAVNYNAKVLDSGLAGVSRRSLLINGGFNVAQRGTSQSTPGYGSVDRWRAAFNPLSASLTMNQREFAPGQSDVPGNPSHYIELITDGGSVPIAEGVEGVRTGSGKTLTLSFYAKADANKKAGISLTQNFGSGGSANVSGIGATVFDITTNWEKYVTTVSVPSIAGKIIGLNDKLDLFLIPSALPTDPINSTTAGLIMPEQSGTFHLAQAKLERGSTDTPFENLLPGEDKRLCERFFRRIEPRGEAPGLTIMVHGASSADGSSFLAEIQYPEMRVPPTPLYVIQNLTIGENSYTSGLVAGHEVSRHRLRLTVMPPTILPIRTFGTLWIVLFELDAEI